MSLTAKGQKVLQELRERNEFGIPSTVCKLILPRPDWWESISSGAKKIDQPHDAFWEGAKNLALQNELDPTLPFWPEVMFQTEPTLPPVSPDEALAILDKFLMLEVGQLRPGVQLFQLQWDVLACRYRPLQERYEGLSTLVNEGVISNSTGGPYAKYHSGLAWPLTINEAAIPRIRRIRWHAKHHRLRHWEQILADAWSSYPKLITLIAAILGGSIFLKLLEWVWGVSLEG